VQCKARNDSIRSTTQIKMKSTGGDLAKASTTAKVGPKRQSQPISFTLSAADRATIARILPTETSFPCAAAEK